MADSDWPGEVTPGHRDGIFSRENLAFSSEMSVTVWQMQIPTPSLLPFHLALAILAILFWNTPEFGKSRNSLAIPLWNTRACFQQILCSKSYHTAAVTALCSVSSPFFAFLVPVDIS